MFRDILRKVAAGGVLARQEALEAGRSLASGNTEPVAAAAFLGALAARGETAEEIAGLAMAFRESMKPFPPAPNAVDTCGTGGDNRATFNLSTAAALTTASLGQHVAKHGNRGVSSACGSADLLESLGYPIAEDPAEAAARYTEHRFAFLFAPKYHPAMAHMSAVRRTMGVRTAFNLLGPLLNPAGVRRQVVGVFSRECMSLVAGCMEMLGCERAMIVHADGGYDEVILSAPTHVIELRNGRRDQYDLGHDDFGLPAGRREDVLGGDATHNAAQLEALLRGHADRGLCRAVAANAALALRIAGRCEGLKEAAGVALDAIESGEVGRFFDALLERQDARLS
ncbi:MAG: anthranilate phosphoribosyltransferase [Acidobacteriota bacterium]